MAERIVDHAVTADEGTVKRWPGGVRCGILLMCLLSSWGVTLTALHLI